MARRRHHRRRRSLALRNPLSASALLSAPKQMVSKDFLIDAGATAAGFVLPNVTMAYLPVSLRDTKVKYYAVKVGTIAVLSAVAGMVNKRWSRAVMIGGGAALLLDLWEEFKSRTTPVAPAATGTKAYYGPGINGTDHFYGGMNGVGDDVVVADDPGAF